jgi:hypothetical protein
LPAGALVLGYVFSRTGGGATDALLTAAQIVGGRPGQGPNGTDIPGVDQWYAQFPTQIDGIYFDNAVLWPDAGGAVTYPVGPGGAAWTAQMFWSDLVPQLRQAHPGMRIMLLAGQCPDEWVVQVPDFALLWEEEYSVYATKFYPLRNNAPAAIPPWWKDPAYLDKISHTVTGCPPAAVQGVLELTRERNAGNVYMLDLAGAGYPRLPPYWNDVVWNVNTYKDAARALSTDRHFRAAHRYAGTQGKLHAWPNGEQATYAAGQVRGTYLLDNDPQLAEWRDVPASDLALNRVAPHPSCRISPRCGAERTTGPGTTASRRPCQPSRPAYRMASPCMGSCFSSPAPGSSRSPSRSATPTSSRPSPNRDS